MRLGLAGRRSTPLIPPIARFRRPSANSVAFVGKRAPCAGLRLRIVLLQDLLDRMPGPRPGEGFKPDGRGRTAASAIGEYQP